MAKRVFFSFHYDDVWRVMQVRNAWVVPMAGDVAGFVDKAEFEQVERKGRQSIERWIDRQLDGTSASVVLIGAETANRPYVQYEIQQSYERGNRLLGVRLDNVKDTKGNALWWRGPNPFAQVSIGGFFGSSIATLLNVPIYDWVNDAGRTNIAKWIDSAPRKERPLVASS